MDNNTIREILKMNSMLFTRAEIEAMMDEELEKDVEEMDTDFIELCLKALEGAEKADGGEGEEKEEIGVPHKRKNKFIKILLVAAITVSLLALSLFAGADLLNIDDTDKGIDIKDGYVEVNLGGDENRKNLKTVLAENGLENPVLPQYLYDNCEVTDVKVSELEDSKMIRLKMELFENKVYGELKCLLFKQDFDVSSFDFYANENNESVEHIEIKDLIVSIFDNNGDNNISYAKDNVKYSFRFENLSYSDILMIVETI